MPTKAPPEPRNTYGWRDNPNWSQVMYDRKAFAERRGVEFGAPVRSVLFRRLASRMMPGYFEWHGWTEQMVETLCENSLVGLPGCCVAGHTRLLDPILGTTSTIQWLCENQIAPVVMTLKGPMRAGVPFVKGEEDLLEVTLSNGHSVCATAGHLVLTSFSNANRYTRVGDLIPSQRLLSYEPIPRESISARDPSTHAPDALCSPKITGDFQEHCSPDFRQYGGQLHFSAGNGQSFSPSPADAPTRSHWNCTPDAQASTTSRSPAPLFSHLSMTGFDLRRSFLGIPAPRLWRSETHGRASRLFQQHVQFQPATSCPQPFLTPSRVVFDSESDGDSFEFSDETIHSCGLRVAQTTVTAIRNLGKRVYYDLTVPDAHHYFAEGCIHHNSGSAKTHNAAGFAVLWWLSAPEVSSVTFISTSIKSLRRRGWAQVMRAYSMVPEIPSNKGNFVDSRMVWQWGRNDDKHAIIGRAVEEGSTQKVADDIKGVHTKRQMVVIDEATAVPAAIYEACANLYSYPDEFVLMLMGNPLNRLDQFGRFCEPAEGWSSVNVETQEWDGKPQMNMGGRQPRIVRFDAEKCPNIVEGRIVSKHLPKKEEVEMARKNSGGGNSPLYWQNFRGFWPPEGLSKTVFSESVLKKNDAYGHHKFTGRNFTVIGAFDPAFGGGDRPALRFARMGQIEGSGIGIEWWPPIIVPLDATSTNPIHFQLAERVKRQCEGFEYNGVKYSCEPESFALDATGEGGGLADILMRIWSPLIIRIEFGGKASEDSASLEDERKSCDVYDNKSTEMHFRARDAVASGQLKGVDPETALELCNRQFDDMRPDGTMLRRIKLQSKKAYKELFKKSPDYGDCGVMILEVARRRGFRVRAVQQTAVAHEDRDKEVEKTQAVWEPESMYCAEELEEMT